MRLDKFVASATPYSRRQVHQLIKQGRIGIDETIASNPAINIATGEHKVLLDGEVVEPVTARYFMINKPAGVVCATTDSQSPTVIDLLPRDLLTGKPLQLVGRLDKDTTGLLFITDDGQWNHTVTSPAKGCLKTYRVDLDTPITENMISELEKGILLRNETHPTLPAGITVLNTKTVLLSIAEGKYHQVKRMFAAVGNHVTGLHRQQIGQVRLDTELQPGQYRPLTQDEIGAF